MTDKKSHQTPDSPNNKEVESSELDAHGHDPEAYDWVPVLRKRRKDGWTPERQRALLREILDKAYSVRQTEEKVKDTKVDSIRSSRSVVTLSPEFKDMVERLENVLGTKVRLMPRGDGGRITIEYYSSEDLENIIKTFLKAREGGQIESIQDWEETA